MFKRGSLAMVTGDHPCRTQLVVIVAEFKKGTPVEVYFNGVYRRFVAVEDSYSVTNLQGGMPKYPDKHNFVSPVAIPKRNLFLIADRDVV